METVDKKQRQLRRKQLRAAMLTTVGSYDFIDPIERAWVEEAIYDSLEIVPLPKNKSTLRPFLEGFMAGSATRGNGAEEIMRWLKVLTELINKK